MRSENIEGFIISLNCNGIDKQYKWIILKEMMSSRPDLWSTDDKEDSAVEVDKRKKRKNYSHCYFQVLSINLES